MKVDLLDRFCQDCQMRDIKNIKIYRVYIKQYIELLDSRSKKPNIANKDDLKDYLSSLRQRGLKQASIDKAFSCLSSFYAYMVDEELVSSNPITPFRRRYLRKYKDDNGSESRQIISVDQASLLVNSTLNSRDKAILVLLFKTGMRLGEMRHLDVDDIDHENMTIKLKLSAKRSNRTLFFDNETKEVLQAWLHFRNEKYANGTAALFVSRIGTRISSSEVDYVV
ncbi:MAG: tyrosine-type recombinase/integrase, partial [Methanotrichaceae archaeon]